MVTHGKGARQKGLLLSPAAAAAAMMLFGVAVGLGGSGDLEGCRSATSVPAFHRSTTTMNQHTGTLVAQIECTAAPEEDTQGFQGIHRSSHHGWYGNSSRYLC